MTTQTTQNAAEEMNAALIEGARLTGVPQRQGAVHLLTFTGLPGQAGFARHVHLVDDLATGGGRAAYVRDWAELLGDTSLRLASGTERLLHLAASLDTGVPVNLSQQIGGHGNAHIRRIAEAMIIAAGGTGFFVVEDGPELAAARAFMTSLGSGGGTDGR